MKATHTIMEDSERVTKQAASAQEELLLCYGPDFSRKSLRY